jgi:hypothetical protein
VQRAGREDAIVLVHDNQKRCGVDLIQRCERPTLIVSCADRDEQSERDVIDAMCQHADLTRDHPLTLRNSRAPSDNAQTADPF